MAGLGGDGTATAPSVVAFVCCDLGGSVQDWRGLIDELRSKGYATADRWERSEDAWQVNYRITHPPVLLLKSERVTLQLSGLSEIRKPVREIRIYPTGVIVFRYVLWPAPTADLSDLYKLRREFHRFRLAGYQDHLRQFYGEDDERRLNDMGIEESDAGISMLPTVKTLRKCCEQFLDPRRVFPAQYARWALCTCPRPDRQSLDTHLASLAKEKEVAYPTDTLEGLVAKDEVTTLRVRAWPGLVLASWEGVDLYVAADDADCREKALDMLELQHQFAFVCRAWIEILDRAPAIDIPTRLSTADVEQLEAQMRTLSRLERSLSASLVEVDSTEAMLVETLRLELANDFAQRFQLTRLKAMVFSRLEAMTRESEVARDILDRNYQEAVNEQADRLQLLFAGAVAAQLTALIPAIFALDKGRQAGVGVAVVLLTVVLWGGFVYVVRRYFSWSAPQRSHDRRASAARAWRTDATNFRSTSVKGSGASR